MKRFDKHIFVCENKRPDEHPRGCCYNKGGAELKEKLKTRLKELGLSSSIRANTAGCLDACEFGPVIVIYPEQTWYRVPSIQDLEEIIEYDILNNKVVERLIIKDKRFNRDVIE
ncbi:MAG: (2Fe-2S) ferredoxin domain-containing protein [Ignavibacteriaceae bacterium]|nr:(2Fe-2S) ferredoxin domain-containing protein [Ignavibacteriaceae bacterium]